MTKKLRSIIITLSVGAIALVAYFVAAHIINNQETASATKVQLTDFSASNIASLKVTLQDGQYYYVTEDAAASTDGANVSYKVTFNGIYEGLAYNATTAKAMMKYACSLTAQRDLGTTDESEYVIYGLDNPLSVVTLTKLDGSTFNIYVGSPTDANSAYYCRVDGSDHVYIISGTNGAMFTNEPNAMRISQFNVTFKAEEIEEMIWQYKDNTPIIIYRDLEKSVFNPFTKYYVSSPWNQKMPINGDVFNELVEGMNVLYISEYITPKLDGSEVNLADYGLDNPWGYYKVTTAKGVQHEFSFGNYVNEDVKYYCYMLDHSTNDIYTVLRDRVSFIMEYSALDVTTPYVLNAYLDDIQYLTAEFNGKTTVLEHKRRYLSEQEKAELEAAGNTVEKDYESTYTLDGMTYDEYALSSLYMCATGMRIQAQNKNYEHEENALLAITYTPFDADEDTCRLEYYKVNDNFCAVYINGKCDFLVSMNAVNAFIDGVAIVKAGGIPPYQV